MESPYLNGGTISAETHMWLLICNRRFRAARKGIMFSSDVSARGVDYPGVTLVVQVCENYYPHGRWVTCSFVP